MPRVLKVAPLTVVPRLRQDPRARAIIIWSLNVREPAHGDHADHPALVVVADVVSRQRAPHHGRLEVGSAMGAPGAAHVAVEAHTATRRTKFHLAVPRRCVRSCLPCHVAVAVVDPQVAAMMTTLGWEAMVDVFPARQGVCHRKPGSGRRHVPKVGRAIASLGPQNSYGPMEGTGIGVGAPRKEELEPLGKLFNGKRRPPPSPHRRI